MRKRPRWRSYGPAAGLAAVASLSLFARLSHAESEGVSFGVNDYDPCGGDDLNYCDDEAVMFKTGLTAIGYDQATSYVNSAVDGSDFVNSLSDHVDPSGTDYADAAYFSGHGSYNCATGGSSTYWSKLFMGDDSDGVCEPLTDSSSADRMRFGEGGSGEELDVLYLFSCNSVQYCVANNDGYDDMGPEFATSNADPFRVLAGFHGLSYDRDVSDVLLYYYILASPNDGLGDTWVDFFYESNVSGSYDQCPTMVVWADSESEADQQYLNGGLHDIKGIDGAPNHRKFYGVVDCDPASGEKLDMLDPP